MQHFVKKFQQVADTMKHSHTVARTLVLGAGLAAAVSLAWAQQAPKSHMSATQRYPITAAQRATATQVAQAGVPLSELAKNAPDEYTVRRGDTLWEISGKFLRSPWRWPQLWGMNMEQIHNPHLIYPGQRLVLDKRDGRAYLRVGRPVDGGLETVHVSPSSRVEMLDANPLPTLKPNLIEPFLAEPIVADMDTFDKAPRIVATPEENRVLVAKGDHAYARGPEDAPLLMEPAAKPKQYRIFRGAKPLIDPETKEVLGYEGHYVGQAELVRSEGKSEEDMDDAYDPPRVPATGDRNPEPLTGDEAAKRMLPVPAKINIVSSKEEIRTGDRLVPEPPRQFRSYVPRAPAVPVDARVVAIYGDSVRYAGQSQVVAINKGLQDGIENGDVLALLSTGAKIRDKTVSEHGELIKLPDERNGLAMVFLPFDRVSYVLVMEITRPVQVDDKLINPR